MSTYLGIDAGGTHTRWALCTIEGTVLSTGASDSVQPAVDGVEAATRGLARLWERIVRTAAGGVETVDHAVAGIAGVADPALARQLGDAVPFPLRVVDDIALAAAGGLDRPGVAVQAGTGSFAVARSASGTLHRRGGLGWLCDDGGSGVDLTLRTVRRLVAAADGRPLAVDRQGGTGAVLASPLAGALAHRFAVDAADVARLGAAIQRLAPRQFAAAAETVLTHAAGGDGFAQSVAQQGVESLAELAIAALEAAELWSPSPGRSAVDSEPVTAVGLRLVVGGGLLQGSEWYRERCVAALRDRGLNVELVASLPGAVAAARLAVAVAHRESPLCDWVCWE